MALVQTLLKLRGAVRLPSASQTWERKRYQHTAPQDACNYQLLDNCLELRYGGQVMHFNYMWLRDHCRSASCYNSKTNQRNLDTGSIHLDIRPDGHVTRYNLAWLTENSYEGQKQSTVQPRVLWNSKIYSDAKVPSASWEKFMRCDEELKMFLNNFLLYGVAFVEDVPATVDATETVSKRVSIIRDTMFGRMWSFTSDYSRGDTAYTKLALDRHTDTTYLQEPCGIQVFHCLRHEGTGGRTLLVDGFYSANRVLEQSPENFDLLSQVPIKHEFIEILSNHSNHTVGIGPVVSVYPWNNEVYMIRYNNYDRAVFNTVPHDVVRRWYAAHRQLTDELRKPENELWVKLKPGKVIFIDNWRVLHGRDSFTGLRQLCGCYLTRDDVLSRARSLGLQA
ncbi:Trimethyllysine dioxygenase, mitochondrial [Bagarius yarrelli]|uniref:Trimethyllysine dioxygenase, mitochondrial n=1 Tax=Bagarius yarrelli TaxID=175774 RepID=A0A556V9J1_BAGYA|nr:Trimethyllysine dioxygenase, mitochondrial [Bagarius yarrelli]